MSNRDAKPKADGAESVSTAGLAVFLLRRGNKK